MRITCESPKNPNIKATLIAMSARGNVDNFQRPIYTFELNFHRFILAEFNTHRVFSRNAASSRAIPIEKQIEMVENNPAVPIHWGLKQKGMQADQENDARIMHPSHILEPTPMTYTNEEAWLQVRGKVIAWAKQFAEAGYHKQVVNRLLEPFCWTKVIMTTTELDNFFKLRNHKDAQPEFQELTDCMHRFCFFVCRHG